jgi:hypothetical protein
MRRRKVRYFSPFQISVSDCSLTLHKKIKRSARRLMNKARAIYISDIAGEAKPVFPVELQNTIPVFSASELPGLIHELRALSVSLVQ